MKSEQQTVFISISSGVIGRNLLSIPEGFLHHAKNRFGQIVLLVPESTKNFYEREYGEERVVIEGVDNDIFTYENNTWFRKVFSFFYTYLLFTENAKGLAWEGVYFASRPKDTISGRLMYPLKWFVGNTFGRSNVIRNRFVPFLDSFINKKKFYTEHFKKYKPSVVFTPNVERWSDICLIRESRKLGVPSVGMPGSWDHFPKRFRPLHPDFLLVNTYTQKNEAVIYQSYKKDAITVVGVPYYDAFKLKDNFVLSREDFCAKLNFDPKKKIIFFSSEGIYAPDDGDVIDIIAKSIEEKTIKTSSQILLRPYPGIEKEHKKFDQFNDVPNIYVDWIEKNMSGRGDADAWYPNFDQVIHFMNCLEHADVAVNSYSSIALEASYFMKQPIWVNFDGYKQRAPDRSIARFKKKIHLKNIYETGGVYMVDSREDLIKKINYILEGGKNSYLEVLRHKMCGPIDGQAGKRIVERLAAVSNNNIK